MLCSKYIKGLLVCATYKELIKKSILNFFMIIEFFLNKKALVCATYTNNLSSTAQPLSYFHFLYLSPFTQKQLSRY